MPILAAVAWTTEQAFNEFYSAINLGSDFHTLANKRRDWIVKRLSGKLEIVEAFPMGSIPRRTALGKGVADLDVLVALHYGKHIGDRKPSAVLRTTQQALSPMATSVRRNGQAVTLRFESWPAVDVVPAMPLAEDGKVVAYGIPDMHRERWLFSYPKDHSKRLRAAAQVWGKDIRKVIKMAKWWNYRTGSRLQSFHIEQIALRSAGSLLVNDLPWALSKWFEEMRLTLARNTPIKVEEERVDAYLDYEKRQAIVSDLVDVCKAATSGWFFARKDNHKAAIAQFKKIFGQEFPTYG